MDPETLVTFLFRAPPEIRTVELIGSWDNFNQPYRMHHDRRRGTGFWSGCFKFENIIFDGEDFEWTKPRSGGLKQGGTYWYYYRLNYDVDAYDPKQEHTTGCPLLPGQAVNVIEVPYEIIEPPTRCRSAYGVTEDIAGTLANTDVERTLDPAKKTAALEPPPMSKVHARCLSDEALDGRLESQIHRAIVVDELVSPGSSARGQEPVLGSRDSELSHQAPRNDISGASSVYSQHSAHSAAFSAVSEGFDLGESEFSEDEELSMPGFPYPCSLRPSALESSRALGAALFTSDDVIESSSSHVGHEEDSASDCRPKHTRKISERSLGPFSVQNVQLYGSRPGTSLNKDEEQYRPRIYSLPNIELRDYLEDDAEPTSPMSPYSTQVSPNVDDDPTPCSEAAFDLISPTFTATTVSSDGNHSPFRLSAQISCSDGARDIAEDDHGLDGIAERLRSLDSQDELHRETINVTRSDRSHTRYLPPTFVNYSLPSLSNESNHSLAKTASMSTPPRGALRSVEDIHIPLPTILSEGEGRSMAEDIFSELGF